MNVSHILVAEVLLAYRNVLGDRGNFDDYRIYQELARRGIIDDIESFEHQGTAISNWPKPSRSARIRVNKAINYARDMGLLTEFRPGWKKYKKMLRMTKDGLATMNHFYDATAPGIYHRK